MAVVPARSQLLPLPCLCRCTAPSTGWRAARWRSASRTSRAVWRTRCVTKEERRRGVLWGRGYVQVHARGRWMHRVHSTRTCVHLRPWSAGAHRLPHHIQQPKQRTRELQVRMDAPGAREEAVNGTLWHQIIAWLSTGSVVACKAKVGALSGGWGSGGVGVWVATTLLSTLGCGPGKGCCSSAAWSPPAPSNRFPDNHDPP